MSEYTEQAENFLKTHNLEFRAVLVVENHLLLYTLPNRYYTIDISCVL